VKEYDPNIIGWPSSMVDKADYDALSTALYEWKGTATGLQANWDAAEDRIRELEAQLERCRSANVYDGNAHRRVSELEAALREGAEFLHAFTPAGTPAVDAFIAKWSDRTPQTETGAAKDG
jgi:hypothetical protein